MEVLTAQGEPVGLFWKRRHVLRLPESRGGDGGKEEQDPA
jgi:hypothetical protein